MKMVYVCTGGCGGKVSAEEYAAGKTTCGAADCPKHGQPFDVQQECETCGTLSLGGKAHTH